MLLCSCPRCHDSIRIPAAATETSVIRCPRCSEEFPLGEIFSALPPEAEVISGPGSEVTVAMVHDPAETAEYTLAQDASQPRTDFQIKDSGPLSSTAPMAKIDSSRPPRKPKRAEPNVFLEFLKIAVGGAAGLGIAVMMIMWFSHQDVFKIVPMLPPQAYFIVPEELHTSEMKTLANQGAEPEVAPEIEPPVETIPADEPAVEPEEEATSETEDQVSFNPPSRDSDASPLAAAFQERVNASQQTKPAKKPATQKPKPVEPKPEPQMVAEEPEPSPPVEAPEPAETEPMEEVVVTGPTEPSPIAPELMEMITAASEELGPIGAEIPPVKQPEPIEPIGEGTIDLSPVDDDEK